MKEAFYTVRGYQLLEQHLNHLTPSLEDYLEMICRGIQQNGAIRVKDLAKDLNVKPSSASKMIQKLAELGFIDYEKYGAIRLTEQGKEVGQYLLWRHNALWAFFQLLAPDNQEASLVEAELTEHILSRETVERLEHLTQFFAAKPEIYQQMQRFQQNEK